jgi:plastocyanin
VVRRLALSVAALVVLVAPSLAPAAVETLVLRSQAFPMKPYQVVQGVTAVPSPRVDGYVVGMTVEVVDTAGRVQTIDDVMLHHAVFVKALVPDYTCGRFYDYDRRPSPLPAERFFGAGEEHMELRLPDGYGYANRSSDIWGLVYMLMNHRNTASTVQVQYRVQYVTGEPRTPVKPVWLDAVNCYADPIFTVPGTGGPGSSFVRTADFTMPESGHLVAGGAHIHGGGQRVELRNASCSGRELFRSRPSWPDQYPLPMMHEPGPAHMTSWSDAAGIAVAAGETLRLRAVYDNSRPHMRVMGIMIAWLAPGSTAACAPTPALSDPLSDPAPTPRIFQPLLRSPVGKVARVSQTAISDFSFRNQRVQLSAGTVFRWRFLGTERHDVTLANGPEGLASASTRRGSFSFRFRRKGTYNLYCSLHPTLMTQRVIVR